MNTSGSVRIGAGEQVEAIGSGPVTLPFRPEWTSRCPSCQRPSTEYHPAERYGRCFDPPDGCGFRWRLENYTVRVGLPWWHA